MREYILYAVLIFLPLGFLMAYFLYREGLNKRLIACLTTVVLVAVILFPICAAKVGTTVSGIVYVGMLVLFSWQMASNSSWGMTSKDPAAEGKPDATTETPVSDHKPALLPEPEQNDEPAAVEISSDVEAAPEPSCAENDNNTAVTSIVEAPLECPQAEADANEQTDAPPLENIPLVDADVIAAGDPGEEGDELNTPTGDNNILEPEKGEVARENPVADIELVEIEAEPNLNTINNWLDAAFEHKTKENMEEAVSCFEAALQLTRDEELKYLLNQELSKNYEIMGNYSKAIQHLKDIMDNALAPVTRRNQAEERLMYLEKVVAELDRLGLGALPITQVPRLIKFRAGQNT